MGGARALVLVLLLPVPQRTAASEAEVNALQAAALGVPIGLLTGDDLICNVAQKQFPGVETVALKKAEGYLAAVRLAEIRSRNARANCACGSSRSTSGISLSRRNR